MGLKTYITHEQLLEGGNAIKSTTGIKQKHVKALLAELLPKIAIALGLSQIQLLPIGSAGKKPNPEDVSGDVDIAVQTTDIERVRLVIEQLGLNGSCKAMPAINVYSFEASHPEGTVQIDLMPVPDLKLAAWSFYSADEDMKLELKGSHRNELLFALAKHCAMTYQAVGLIAEGERTRYQLNLNHGLFKVKQSKIGKRGTAVKSYSTISKEFITSDPDQICKILFGYDVPAGAVLSFNDALRALIDLRFGYSCRVKVIEATVDGLNRKGLKLPIGLTLVGK